MKPPGLQQLIAWGWRTGVVLYVLLVPPCLFAQNQRVSAGLRAGDTAPNFNLNRLGGEETIRLYDLVGKAADGKVKLVVISFFATWCKPCREEMPLLQEIHEKLSGKGAKVLSIVVEGNSGAPQDEILKNVGEFVRKAGITFPILYDPFMKDVVAAKYLGETMELPGVYLVGPDAIVRKVFHSKQEDLIKQVEREIRAVKP